MTRRPRLSSASLDALLDGEYDDGALARVLTAARAPGAPQDLAGLEATRAAFVRVSHAPGRPPIGVLSTATKKVAGRLLAVKAVAAISGATLIGGVAYAASTTGLLGNHPSHHPGQQQSVSTSESASRPNSHSAPHGGGQLPTATHPNQARGSSDHPQPGRATTPAQVPPGRPSDIPSTIAGSRQPSTVPSEPAPSSSADQPSSTPPPTTGHAKTTPPPATSSHGRPPTRTHHP